MDIIKYGNLYKKEKKVKAKCPHCGTKVAMVKGDYQLYDYQTNMIWTCPFCEKTVTTKRFSIYRTWDRFRNHPVATPLILIWGSAIAITAMFAFICSVGGDPDDTDNYLIDYHYNGTRYQEYVDDYKLEGATLYIWDDEEKTQYNSVTFNKVTTLKEEE